MNITQIYKFTKFFDENSLKFSFLYKIYIHDDEIN